MKFLISLLLVLQTCAPTYAASTRTLVADQIKNSPLTNTYLFPASGDTLVGRTSTDTLTNKTLTTPAIDIPLFTDQSSTPVTPAAGKRKFYSKTTGKFYQLDSAGVEREIGSGGTGTNFVVGGDAEGGSIFATYKDAVQAAPVDGTGGIQTVANITTTAVSPLVGANSFLLTHPASNVQGEGWSYDFTIDAAYQAKVLQISFDYIVNSGTFVAGSPSADSDITVWIYDKTNNVLIQPSSYKLLSQSATVSDKFNATFQTASNSTSYRLIFHNATTSAAAFTLRMDSVTISPSTYVYGTPVTDWQTYTPTMTGLGTVTITDSFFKRVGDSIYIKGRFSLGTPTGATAAIGLPAGYVIDSGKMTIQSTIEGNLTNNSAATVFLPLGVGADTSVGFSNAASSGLSKLVGTSIGSSGNNIGYAIGPIPILGFSSSVQMSDQTDTRVVDFYGTKTSTQSVTANVTDISFVMSKDSHNAWSGSAYTVVVPGDYLLIGQLSDNATTTQGVYPWISGVKGAQRLLVTPSGNLGNGTIILTNLKSGDIVSLRSDQTTTLANLGHISLVRISGSSSTAATDSTTLSYLNTAGTSIGISATIVPFATKEWDSHGLWNVANANAFTAQVSGKYQVSIVLTNAGVNLATNQGFFVDIYKNGTFYKHVGSGLGTGGLNNHCASGTVDIQLNAGEYFDVRAISSVATTLLTSNGYNSISVKRVGN